MSFRNILVTGGCGFIGTNFIRYLFEESDFDGRVINLDVLTYAGNPANLSDLVGRYPGRYIFVKADICDREAVTGVMDRYEVDAVCHFAAESHVDRSIVGPGAFIQTNIVGTFNLLELARAYPARLARFHHVSTDEVYGSLGPEGAFTEETPYRPNSPYSASKAASDHLVRAYHQTYGLPITISNCSNNYGPFQFPEKLIPLMILNAWAGKALPVYGDGRNIRDWLYVRDHCVALWEILQGGQPGETYNVGGGTELENIALVKKICAILDEGRTGPSEPSTQGLITFVKDRPGHDRRYAVDCSRIRAELGWRPQESFESGLRKTIAWYRDNPEWVRGIQSGEYRRWIAAHYG